MSRTARTATGELGSLPPFDDRGKLGVRPEAHSLDRVASPKTQRTSAFLKKKKNKSTLPGPNQKQKRSSVGGDPAESMAPGFFLLHSADIDGRLVIESTIKHVF